MLNDRPLHWKGDINMHLDNKNAGLKAKNFACYLVHELKSPNDRMF